MTLADFLRRQVAEREQGDECWEWPFRLSPMRRGVVSIDGVVTASHRAAFYVAHGHWPNICRHTCDNPPCFNPAHLRDGTQRDNIQDAVTKGRHARGASCGRSKLTERDVAGIKALLAAGAPVRLIAPEYGVSAGAVSHIRSHGGWTETQPTVTWERTPMTRCGTEHRGFDYLESVEWSLGLSKFRLYQLAAEGAIRIVRLSPKGNGARRISLTDVCALQRSIDAIRALTVSTDAPAPPIEASEDV